MGRCEGEVGEKKKFSSLRSLSLEGKAFVIKLILLPILLFLYYVFPAPDRVFKKIVEVMFYLFWSSKMEKLKRDKGGKGVVCIERFLVLRSISMCLRLSKWENLGVF